MELGTGLAKPGRAVGLVQGAPLRHRGCGGEKEQSRSFPKGSLGAIWEWQRTGLGPPGRGEGCWGHGNSSLGKSEARHGIADNLCGIIMSSQHC